MSVELRVASSLPLGELAALFTRAYEDYLVPMQVDEDTLRYFVRTFDLDPDAGFVAYDDGTQVGLVNLGVRGDRGWIGGVGVVPEARRKGIGRLLMEAVHGQARERGIREVSLEVLEANDAAYRLYEDLGYEMLRWVEIGSLEPVEGEPPAEVGWEDAHARIAELRTARDPWQRDDDTLQKYDDLRGLRTDTGAAVFRATTAGPILLLQFAGDQDAAREVLSSLRTLGPLSVFNIPEDDPVAAAFRELGGEPSLRQREMSLSL